MGNGSSTNIWNEKWIIDNSDGLIHPLALVPHSAPSTVDHLIDWETRTWNLEQINNFISYSEARSIEPTLMGDHSGTDCLVLPWTKNRTYSVKSGYGLYHIPTSRER